jgi:uncharacterized protein YyaL (SSP411 family)
MPRPFFALLPAALLTFLTVSCSEKKSSDRDSGDEGTDYYFGVDPSRSLASLENEMAGSPSDFLKSFAEDEIPWQRWNEELRTKADQAQVPIFAFVGSTLAPNSRRTASEIDQSENFRRLVAGRAVCTVVDTHLHPEIGQLSFHLSQEINRSVALPMAIWLSPEGSPIVWYPLGSAEGNDLERILDKAYAIITDTWQKDSRYLVEHSRFDNSVRQQTFNHEERDLETGSSRDELFRSFTRKLSSLYSPVSKSLDSIGGLLPTGSLELLAIGSRSGRLTEQVRDQCRQALRNVIMNLRNGAIHDPLDGNYFHARRTGQWVLPFFTKTLESQANFTSMLLQAGTILEDEAIIAEGLSLLETLETDWFAKSISVVSPSVDQDEPGLFLWKTTTLDDLLTEEEAALAKRAFSLSRDGNIPLEVDPLGRFFGLNSLRNNIPAPTAEAAPGTGTDNAPALKSIREKLLEHRNRPGNLTRETTLTVRDWTMVLQSQIARAIVTARDDDLQRARSTADQLLTHFHQPENGGLMRLRRDHPPLPARGKDYAATSHVFLLLYQLTLEEKWLRIARNLFDHALETLVDDSGLIGETPPGKEVIPVQLHNVAMIFGESTLGLADLAATRLSHLTGQPKYRELGETHLQVVASREEARVTDHSDFIVSCALGTTPLVAVLQGEPSSSVGKEWLATLNSSRHLPFLTIRPETSAARLAPLPDLPPAVAEISVVLLRGAEILGQAGTLDELTSLLDSAISEPE